MKNSRVALVFAAACAATFALAAPASAAIITVTTESDDPDLTGGTGTCETWDGNCSLRAALQTANDGPGPHTIRFAVGSGAVQIDLADALP